MQIKDYEKRFKDLQIKAEFDEEGNLVNREQILEKSAGSVYYEEIEDLISKYDEAIEKANDYQVAIQEGVIALKDLAFEKIQTTLELKLKINERDLKLLEYELSKLENLSFSQAAQAANISEQYIKQTKIMDSNLQTIYDIGKEYNIV
jgi:hypothetical protein